MSDRKAFESFYAERDIRAEVVPAGCRAAVEVSDSVATDNSNIRQYTAQCGARGFQIEVAYNYQSIEGLGHAAGYKSSVARLCAAMCIDCPNNSLKKLPPPPPRT